MSYLLGIDLGSTAVTAAVHPAARDGVHTLPAVLVATPDGDLLCGEPARRRAPADPGRVARGFLERVGDPTPLSLGGVAYRAEDLCARLVRSLTDTVARRHGGPPARIGVTHPASWGRHKRDLLAAALTRQGITASLVAASQAVALAHRATAPGAHPLAVVDLGGTGTSVTVLAPATPGTVPAVVGRPTGCRAGGADVDDAVFAFVRTATPELAAATEALDTEDPRVRAALTALREACRTAKEELSTDTVTTVPVALPGVRTSVRIHRSDLDGLAGPLLEPVADPLAEALGAAPDAEVLLAGGVARMPLAVQILSDTAGRPLSVAADPLHDAARGAALAAAPGAGTSWPGTRTPPVPAGAIPAQRAPVAGPPTGPAGPVGLPDTATGRLPSVPVSSPALGWNPALVSNSAAVSSPAPVPSPAPAWNPAPVSDPASVPMPVLGWWSPEPGTRDTIQGSGGPAGTVAATRATTLQGGRAPAGIDRGTVPASAPAPTRVTRRPERPAPAALVVRDAAPGPVPRVRNRQRLLIGAGGLAGVAAVAGTLLLWPSEPSLGELSAAPTLPATSVPVPAPVAPAAPQPGAGAVAGPASGDRPVADRSGGADTATPPGRAIPPGRAVPPPAAPVPPPAPPPAPRPAPVPGPASPAPAGPASPSTGPTSRKPSTSQPSQKPPTSETPPTDPAPGGSEGTPTPSSGTPSAPPAPPPAGAAPAAGAVVA